MSNLIIYQEKNVPAKGLNPNNNINRKKVKDYFFEDDLINLELLDKVNIPITKTKISVLYPGCGADILFPLFYLDKLFPKLTKVEMTFVDYENTFGIIKTILDEVGVSFEEEEEKEKNQIKFYWNKKLITLNFVIKKVEEYFSNLGKYDLYFEKAFRIMRDQIENYELKILEKLNFNAIIISDTGFKNHNLKEIKAPKELSSYGEMFIGIKS